jgi:hypothetical protein
MTATGRPPDHHSFSLHEDAHQPRSSACFRGHQRLSYSDLIALN